MHHNEAGGGGLPQIAVRDSEKLSNFKAYKLLWTVNELWTCIVRVPSLCLPMAHIHKWTLWKSLPSAVFISKMQQDKTTEIRNIKL